MTSTESTATASVAGDSPIDAWTRACRFLDTQPDRKAFHLTARIGTTPSDPDQQQVVDALLDRQRRQPSETVANTIFPAGIAASCPEPGDLADRYLKLYPRLRQHPKNRGGTYFGRLVAYPGGDAHANQLADVIAKLRREIDNLHKSSVYECAIYSPADDAAKSSGFPCLSSCAFHLDAKGERLYLTATYRNQLLFERGLGNYIGLARLRDYVAGTAGLKPAELLVVAGHAELDGPYGRIRTMLTSAPFTQDDP